jgi:hypothetical protein
MMSWDDTKQYVEPVVREINQPTATPRSLFSSTLIRIAGHETEQLPLDGPRR